MQSFAVSTASKRASLSSCKSLLYVVGIPFKQVNIVTKCPYIRPDLPRNNSHASGFFFCGIKLLPVAYASDIFTKPNSVVPYTIKSSANLLKCIANKLVQNKYSAIKSRSDTASILFNETSANFKSFANNLLLILNG